MNARPKSVLFVGAFPAPAPLTRYVSGDLALRLATSGWDVKVTSRSQGRIGRVWEIIRDVWRTRQQYEVVCLDLYSGPAFYWAELACRIIQLSKKPFVLILHGGDLPAFSRRHLQRVKRLFLSAAAVTCPSRYLLKEMAYLREDIVLLPNPLDLPTYGYRERPQPLTNLVWLRAFHEIYNPEMAIQVLLRIRQQHAGIRLTMIGPDKGDGSLQRTKQTAARLGVDGVVAFRGAVPKQDVPKCLEEGDIFLNTTNFDNTPVSVLEAMACGLPVVSTNVGGIPYLLEDGKTALLSPPAGVDAMADSVTRLLREPQLADQLARNGRRMVEAFDWAVVLPQWEKLLQNLLTKTRSANHGMAATKFSADKTLTSG